MFKIIITAKSLRGLLVLVSYRCDEKRHQNHTLKQDASDTETVQLVSEHSLGERLCLLTESLSVILDLLYLRLEAHKLFVLLLCHLKGFNLEVFCLSKDVGHVAYCFLRLLLHSQSFVSHLLRRCIIEVEGFREILWLLLDQLACLLVKLSLPNLRLALIRCDLL